MSKKTNNKIKLPSVFAFERKISPSDALLFHGNWDERDQHSSWQSLCIREKAVRGTVANKLKNSDTSDPTKLDAKIENPNLQKIDFASLPPESNTLKISFTLRFLSGIENPCACNDTEYLAQLKASLKNYSEIDTFNTLSKRYATNIANGRFLWRNRLCANNIEVRVTTQENIDFKFKSQDFDLNYFKHDNDELNQLANEISAGFLGKKFSLLTINAFVHLGNGQEIFPSQELVLDDTSSKKGKKSKYLYQVNNIAAMHSQKIGNAIRTIDDWYSHEMEYGPIPVDPYGAVTSIAKALRQPNSKNDFYNLLDQWVNKNDLDINQQHFVIANLIRGGVFSEKSDKKESE